MMCVVAGRNTRKRMSKALKSLSMLVAAGLAVGSPHSSDARVVPARSGSSAFFGDATCWSPFGPTMTNAGCSDPNGRPWYVPLILDSSFVGFISATVTATAAIFPDDVRCQLMSADKNGFTVMASGFFAMPFAGGPSDLTLQNVFVPPGGTAMIDCQVRRNSRVATLTY
jgi:hypothetical protein